MKLNKILIAGAICSASLLTAQAEEESALSGWVSLDVNSHFMSYGANVWGDETEDIGDEILFNPSAGLEYSFDEKGAVYIGAWADINSLATGDVKHFSSAGGDVQEIDLWIGYYFTVGDFTFDLAYQSWLYAGENEGIVDFTVSYDFLFSPYIKMHNRVEGVGDQETGTMYEIGATVYEGEIGDNFTYSIPVAMGFSFDDFHVQGEDGYAYSYIALNGSYALPIDFLGDWDLHGGITAYSTDEDTTGNDDSSYLTASFGIGLSF